VPICSTSPETLFNFSVPMLKASHRALIMSRSSRRDVPIILVKIKEDNNDMTPMTTQASGCEITQYEASYPALTRFLPALQVANGGRSDNT
jgi:hypothetical protein